MRTNLIIVDDFYTNPDEVRQLALSQDFSPRAGYPGNRTGSFINQSIMATIQNILQNVAGSVTDWNIAEGLTGSFELATAADRSWIHTDHYNTWAGVCYLTPDAPISGGTAMYLHKATGARYQPELTGDYESQDMTRWEMVDQVGNIYNRLVLYRSDMFHTSIDYFGKTKNDARLFQLFFLTTEY
jgi:hypothetical protein